MAPLDRPDSIPASGPETWVRNLDKNEGIIATCCSPVFWLVWIHWNGNFSQPCYKDHAKCPGHRQGLPRRVKGYLFAHVNTTKRYEFVELTPQTMNKINEVVPHVSTLRGVRLDLKRGDGKKARIKVALHSVADQETIERLPADRDPIKTLCKIWGIEDLESKPGARPGLGLEG